MRRIAFYVLWDREGRVRDHVAYYLAGLREVADDVLVVVNGELSDQGRGRLKSLGVEFFVRENRGLDFAAWQAAFARTGREKLALYDELILCNCSCYGPVYPFSDMFGVMEQRKCDFWGINRQPEVPGKVLGSGEHVFCMKEHIQSYFYVFRRTVMLSGAFESWWRNLVPATSYWEEVRAHELEFSSYLEAHGFSGDTFMNFQKYRETAPLGDAWNVCADMQLEDGNPLVKRKAAFASTEASLRLWEHLRYRTAYPVEYMLADYPEGEFSFPRILRYGFMRRICRGEKKKRYGIKEKKALFLHYLDLK